MTLNILVIATILYLNHFLIQKKNKKLKEPSMLGGILLSSYLYSQLTISPVRSQLKTPDSHDWEPNPFIVF